MKFKANSISKLTLDNGSIEIRLTSNDRQSIIYGLSQLKEGDLSVEIKKYRNSRSLQQNRFMWEMLSKLTKAMSGYKTSSDIMKLYCDILEEANIESDFVMAKSDKLLKDQFRAYRQRGTRKVTNVNNEEVELNVYQVWVGSSNYDTKQMNELLEILLKHCAEHQIYDIETDNIRRIINGK